MCFDSKSRPTAHTAESYLCLVPLAQLSYVYQQGTLEWLALQLVKSQSSCLARVPSTPVTLWRKVEIHLYRTFFQGVSLNGSQGGLGYLPNSCICIVSTLTYTEEFIWGGVLKAVGGGSWCWLWEGFALSFLLAKYVYSPPNHPTKPSVGADVQVSAWTFHLWADPSKRCPLRNTPLTPTFVSRPRSTATASVNRFLTALFFYSKDLLEHTSLILGTFCTTIWEGSHHTFFYSTEGNA